MTLIFSLLGLYIVARIILECADDVRRVRLTRKYLDVHVVKRILDGMIWPGQTAEQLMDAIGMPEERLAIAGGHASERWYYDEIGHGRYRLAIVLQHGVVQTCEEHRLGQSRFF